jgi:hypothetical protein
MAFEHHSQQYFSSIIAVSNGRHGWRSEPVDSVPDMCTFCTLKCGTKSKISKYN